MKRLLLICLTASLAVVIFESVSEAGPQWRLRRWSSQKPIDPTIRTTPRFTSSSKYSYSGYTKSGYRWRSRR